MNPVFKTTFWASFHCSNSANFIKVSDSNVIDRITTGFTEIIDTGSGAIVIVNDAVIHRCDVIDRRDAHGQKPALAGKYEQQLVRPYCHYQNVIEGERRNILWRRY